MTHPQWRVLTLVALVALVHPTPQVLSFVTDGSAPVADLAEPDHWGQQPTAFVTDIALSQLKQWLADFASRYPETLDPEDVQNFLNDEGAVAAYRFLNQKGGDVRRAFYLTVDSLRRRKALGLARAQAGDFPCDLFKMGLIFEQGHAHHQAPDGSYVDTNPIIWLRLGALGTLVKQLERFSPSRVISYAYNTPVDLFVKARDALTRRPGREQRRLPREHRRLFKNMSARENITVQHLLRAIAWWLDDWANRNKEAQATLVLDFEDTDFAFASWSTGEFLVKLNDIFPDLFDQILGFRYRAKLWSLHSPISMFNRIFKSRVTSSVETDEKLKFIRTEPLISAYMPRVDAQGYTMLPAYISGVCQGPDDAKAPVGCQNDLSAGGNTGLYDPNLWAAVHNEFYYSCKAKPREQ